jgi:transmembrane sensor
MASLADHRGEERDRRLAEAATWRVTLSEAELETSEDFEAWLAADARNATAWRHMEGLWDHFGDNATAPELMAARQETLERASRSHARRHRVGWRRAWGSNLVAASAAAVAVLAGLAAGGAWYVTKPDVYHTALGERRTVLLSDGSRVALDSNTVLQVRMLARERKLDLIRGQARFDVAHDADRPFQVHARGETVVATGTSFNVDLIGQKVLVTLIEGTVSILQDRPARFLPAAPQAPAPVLARLTSGEELITPETHSTSAPVAAVQVVQNVNLDKTTAWESGQLIFEDEPLSSVAERVSRYAAHPVTAEGSAGALRISGVFNAGDTATFVDTVQRAFPVQVEQAEDGSVTLRPRD